MGMQEYIQLAKFEQPIIGKTADQDPQHQLYIPLFIISHWMIFNILQSVINFFKFYIKL